MADHLEYLDDMIEKTIKIEESMEGLKDTYSKKKKAYTTVGWMESAEIDRLFETAAMQKEELSLQVEELKALMQEARAKGGFAVDAPDGTSDAMRKENLKQVNQIIDFAAEHEDKDKIEYEHKMSIRGVDAPDGTSDDMSKENVKQAFETIEYEAKYKDQIEEAHKMKIRGVDAPDGMSDAMIEEDMKEVDQFIEFAAEHEDKDKIEYEHKMEEAVRAKHARDPERDW